MVNKVAIAPGVSGGQGRQRASNVLNVVGDHNLLFPLIVMRAVRLFAIFAIIIKKLVLD